MELRRKLLLTRGHNRYLKGYAAVVLVMTPTDIPQVRSNCRQWLKVLRGRGGAAGITSHYNNLDAALTGFGGVQDRCFKLANYLLQNSPT